MKSVIIIPTYNERDNLPDLLAAIFAEVPNTYVLIVDDNSPDGTGQLADTMSSQDSRIRVLHRSGKLGLGTAYIEGFKLALATGFDYIFEMDADFSHDPRYLPRFLEVANQADLVVGSRYIPGGSTPNWSLWRRLISGGGNTFTRLLLRLPVHDCTSGFRCYHRSALLAIDLDSINCRGYAFQVELVYRVLMRGLRVTEIPIAFVDRRVGKSKMSQGIFFEAFRYVLEVRRNSGRAPRNSIRQVKIMPPQALENRSPLLHS